MMRRYFFVLLILVGFSLLFATATSLTTAQGDDDEREYIGSRECAGCHRLIARDHEEAAHALALIESRDDEFVVADFETGQDVRTIQLPGEDEPTTFTLDDVEFVLGSGRYAQRFVYEVDRNEYVVLPVEWNSVNGEWQPYGPVENFPDDPAYDFGFSCAGCHTTGLNVRRTTWEDNGVQCEACHGPGSIHADEADDAGGGASDRELRDIRGAIVRSPDPAICGQCHIRGTEPEDGHPFPQDYIPGGENELLDEDVFVPVAVDDPTHWWVTGHARLSNMQFNEWLNSAHASSLETMKGSTAAEDACLQCHSGDYRFTDAIIQLFNAGDLEGDPPDPITIETAQLGVTCATCHNPHVVSEEIAFNLVDEPYALCVDCHTNTDVTAGLHHPVQQMFEGQTLVESVEGIPGPHYSAEDGPNCLTCHMSRVPVQEGTRSTHTWRLALPGETEEGQPNTCETCHDGLAATDLQYLINDTQAAIQSRLSLAFTRLGSVTQPEEGSPAAEQYAQVLNALTFVQNDGSFGVHNYDYASALLDFAERGLSELSVPGAVLEPTEGPAPTATPSGPVAIYREPPEVKHSGIRPAGILILGLAGLVVIGGAVVFFRYFAQDEE